MSLDAENSPDKIEKIKLQSIKITNFVNTQFEKKSKFKSIRYKTSS